MRKREERILTLPLVVVLSITLMLGVLLLLTWDRDVREQGGSIAVILASVLVTPVLIACFLAVLMVEINVYFNLRYFLLCESKSRRRTMRNILMLASAGVTMVFGAIGALTDSAITHAAASLCTGGFVLMLILRVADFIFMKCE